MGNIMRQRFFGAAILSAVAFVALGPAPAFADYPASVKSACKRDFKTYCPKYDVGSAQLRQCMKSAFSQLSPRCIEALESSGERRPR